MRVDSGFERGKGGGPESQQHSLNATKKTVVLQWMTDKRTKAKAGELIRDCSSDRYRKKCKRFIVR